MNHKGLGSFLGGFWAPERARGSKNHQFRLCFNKGFAKNAAVPNFMPKKHPFRLVLIRVSWRQQNSKNACGIPSISLGFYKGFVTKQHDMWIHAENLPFRFVLIRVSRRRKCAKISCKIPTISLGLIWASWGEHESWISCSKSCISLCFNKVFVRLRITRIRTPESFKFLRNYYDFRTPFGRGMPKMHIILQGF